MTEQTGRDGAVLIGANPIAAINDFNLTEGTSPVQLNKMGQTHEEWLPGLNSWSGDLNCYWDADDTLGQGALTVGAEVTIAFYPFGNTAGKKYKSGTALVETIGDAVPADGMVTKAITFKGSGPLVEGTVA